MSDIFIKIFNIGMTAGWLVLAILLLRPLMRRVPKWISCLLWGIVGLRLIFPFSLESVFSLIPSAEPLPQDIMTSPAPVIDSGIGILNSTVNPIISDSLPPQVGASASPMQILLEVAAYIWASGIVLILIYGVVSYVALRIKVRPSIKCEDNVYFCDEVDSPFILGVIRPRVYLPSGLSGEALGHVLAHERAHLGRMDHIWKPLGFALLAVYWFNPLIWVGYALLCRDIEAACDEKVIGKMDDEAKKDYSLTLLACSLHRKRIMACPLAFGEVGVKARVKSVLNYKKPAFWVIIAALVVTVALSVCFLTNPVGNVRELLEPGSEWASEGNVAIEVTVDNSIRMTGTLSFEGMSDEIVIRYRSEGKNVYAEIYKSEVDDLDYDGNGDGLVGPEEYADVSAEQLLLSGILKARGDDFVLKIEEDVLGIGEEKLVFKKTKDSGNRTVKLPSEEIYVNVTDCGSNKRGAEITFIQAKIEGGDVVFTLKWKNKSFKTQIYGESFEVYRYEGDELILLDFIGYWKEFAIGVSAFSMTYPSFNITEHFDISALGKYRLVAGDAWVEFEVTESLGFAFPYDIGALGNGLYAAIRDFGCDVEGIEVEFRAVQYQSKNERSFFIDWKNSTGKAHAIGSEFEVYRYDGKEYILLDNKTAWETDAVEVDANSELSHSYMITEHYDISSEGKYRFESSGAWVVFEVKPLYDIYTSFDASNGLDVYVWQMAQSNYSFAMMPHDEKPESSMFFFDMPGVNAAAMREILAAYNIDDEDIYIVPWQNPISSYLGPYWFTREGEDVEAKRAMYEAIIRDMLLGDTVREKYPSLHETEFFDMNGDGRTDACSVGIGLDDGQFFFTVEIRYLDSNEKEIFQRFDSEPMLLEFDGGSGKTFRLTGTKEDGSVHHYSVSVKNGQIKIDEIQ